MYYLKKMAVGRNFSFLIYEDASSMLFFSRAIWIFLEYV